MILFNNKEDWLRQNTALHPDKIFIRDKEKSLTYKAFDELVNCAATYFSNRDINPGDNTALLLENSIEFVAAVISLWRLNAVPVPINTRLLPSEINSLIARNNFPHLIAANNLDSIGIECGNKIVFPNNFDRMNCDRANYSLNGSDKSVVIFTSGSTSFPKGVVHTFDSLYASACGVDSVVNHSAEEGWLASLPFYHIGGFAIIIRALVTGTSIIIPDSISADGIIDSIVNLKPEFISLVPTAAKRLLELDIKPPDNLKAVFIGGGPSESSLIRQLFVNGWKPIKVYGSTETGSMITALPLKNLEAKIASSGLPIGKNIISITGESGEEMDRNKLGYIIVASDSTARAYLNDPAMTDEKFKSGKYFTGDFGFIDEDGFLFIESRREDLIVSGGENISPKEVESALLEYEIIADAAVFALPDDTWGQIVCAAVVLKKDFRFDEDGIKLFLKGKISSFKIPKRFFESTQIPRNELGKLQKSALLKLIIPE